MVNGGEKNKQTDKGCGGSGKQSNKTELAVARDEKKFGITFVGEKKAGFDLVFTG